MTVKRTAGILLLLCMVVGPLIRQCILAGADFWMTAFWVLVYLGALACVFLLFALALWLIFSGNAKETT